MWACYNYFSIVIISLQEKTQKDLASIFNPLKDLPGEKELNFFSWTGCWMWRRALPSESILCVVAGLIFFFSWQFTIPLSRDPSLPGSPSPVAYCPRAQPFTAWLWPILGLTASHCPQALLSSGLHALNHSDTVPWPWSQSEALSTALPALAWSLRSKSPFMRFPRSSLRLKDRGYTVCAWACLLGFCFPQ